MFGLTWSELNTTIHIWFVFISDPANPSVFKNKMSQFFFDGDANDPNVQAVIKTNYISLLASYVPPFFCASKPADCNVHTVEVFPGSSGITKYNKE